uniref:Uncharacterized protein n=1 Tax=Tanacetum cinerariifolium TaxID=118510 RepID=A0A6L2MM15_TANCI|nr:hypothetical protein [Tanacetum cinerariifolium]
MKVSIVDFYENIDLPLDLGWLLRGIRFMHTLIFKTVFTLIAKSDEIPLPEYFRTASEERFPLLSQRVAPAEEVCTAEKLSINRGQRHFYISQRQGSETLEQTFNRLQAIVSHLEFIDVEIEQDDLNHRFLTSLAPEWLMYTIVWRNKSDLDTMSLDDLYNHLKVYEPEVQKKSESNSQNMAFISSAKNSSEKGKLTLLVFQLPALKFPLLIDEDDIEEMDIKWNMALLSMKADRFWKNTGEKITIKGWDWSYMANEEENHALIADEEAPTEFALMAKSSSKNEVEARLVEFKNQEIKLCEKIRGVEFNVESKNNRIERLTNELEELKKEKEGLDSKLIVLFPPPAQVYSPPKKDMSWTGLPEFANDTITDYSRPSPSIESNSNDLQSSNSSISKNEESSSSILSKHVITFLKATDSPTVIKTNKDETVRKSSVKYAEMYRKTSKSSNEIREKLLRPQLVGFGDLNRTLLTKGKGSGTSTEPHHTPSPEAQQSPHTAPSSPSQPSTLTEIIPTSTPTEIPTLRQYSRRARIAQSTALPTTADEPASPLGDASQGSAFPTVSGLEAGQDRENIIKTSALPHDSTPRVTSLAADEVSMQHHLQELTELYTRLQRQQTEMATKIAAQDLEISNLKARITFLEDKDRGGAEPSREDATIKGRSLETEEEAGVEKSTEREVSTVGIPTGSGLVPTASPIFTTASVVTPYLRRKGKEKMVESDTPKKKLQKQIDVQVAREIEEQMAREDQRRSEQIARDAEIARIRLEEELHMLIDGLDRNNEVIARHLHEYEQAAAELTIGEKIDLINELVKYQDHHAKILKYQTKQSKPLSKKQQREFYMSVLKSHSGWKTKHFKGMTLEEISEKFISVWKQIEDFVPIASKEEGERVKRKGLRLEQESAKNMKTSEEVSEEDLKEMMQLVPVEEVYVEALQVKHPIIDWEIHTEGKRDYWKIIRLGGSTSVYQFFMDMLKHLDREDLNQL